MLLEIKSLRVSFGAVHAIDGLDAAVEEGECRGILGESGSGKSTLARTLLGLDSDAQVSGSARLGDTELLRMTEAEWRRTRWREVALAFQAPAALNPALRIGLQVEEPMRHVLGLEQRTAKRRARSLLERVGLPAGREDARPAELSTGQQRLVVIAIALACDPRLLILDEPTSGLDPLTRGSLLELLRDLRRERPDGAMLVLGHDVEALKAIADSVQLLYAGRCMELGPARSILEEPRHPYSWALLNARPGLGTVKEIRAIPGENPDPTQPAPGCPFVPRCPQSIADCSAAPPPLVAAEGRPEQLVSCVRSGLVTVLQATGVRFSHSAPFGRRIPILHGVDLRARAGEVVGIVGQTGAGKTTLAMCLTGHVPIDAGCVAFEGHDVRGLRSKGPLAVARRLQLLFQDPFEASSRRLTVEEIVREPLDIEASSPREAAHSRVVEAIEAVHLPITRAFLDRRAHELSGGQLQRVTLARALVTEPSVLVADEPVAMLDPSEQAKALQLLKRLQVERGLALILISHDIAVVMRLADRILVLDAGRVIDRATGDQLIRGAGEPLTRELLAAAGAPSFIHEEVGHGPR